MKRKLVLLSFVLLAFTGVQAQRNVTSQEYTTALGVKFYPGAITLKHFVSDKAALDFLGYFWKRGTRITGLYELHFPIPNATALKWYVGPGAHVGFYNSKWGGGTAIGVDGVLGLDYKVRNAPLNLSLDWQPSFEFGDHDGFDSWGGLSIRYVF